MSIKKIVKIISLGLILSPGLASSASVEEGLKALEEKQFEQALRTLNEAFQGGEADAGFYLGRMVELGVGVVADPAKARLLYLSAADKGSAKSLNRLGLMAYRGEGVLQDYSVAREAFCKSADMGDKDGQFNCAGLWGEGRGGEKDPSKAIDYYALAGEQGHIGALNALGYAYKNGIGTEADPSKSLQQFEKTACQGNPIGLFEVGQAYEQGNQVSQELLTAHMYYNLATARRHPEASAALSRVTALLDQAAIESAQGKARAWKASPSC